ncbi:alpha/beta fold hydrolase [Kordia algicida OT-1]|uniref:Hydrolase with alpha/beta fold protein n=1 Tax=Kordia algicida OT-1 TaxID=391587 RepID=A9DVV1_9FLAO|nr:alpha/beta fold hydrolase [Kordia algicida]EDP96470.1 hydrolase with alpha/beta fold protein [Kordia algicida OT-1]
MKYLKTFGFTIIAIYLFITSMLVGFQEKIIFRSEVLPQDHVFTSSLPFEELYLKATDDAILHGLHYKQENPQGIILYFHGNARTIDYWGKWAEQLSTQYNYDVVIMDYRGYGKSMGKRSHKKMLDDALLFYDYAQTKFTPEKTIIFGRSLGGAFATHVAKQRKAKLLILESTFTNVLDIARKQFWFLPLKWLLKYPFQNDKNIKEISMPTHIIHGTDDEVVPYSHGQKLYKKSGSNFKKCYTIKEGLHNNLIDYPEYFQALDSILKK